MSGCRGHAGIILHAGAVGSTITDTISRDNAVNGIDVWAANSTVRGCSALSNSEDGVCLDAGATDSVVAATLVGNNSRMGFRTCAPRSWVENCSVGVTLDGAPCGNGQDGIRLGVTAIDSTVMGTVVGNSIRNGIITYVPRTRVESCSVGVTLDGAPCGNGIDGIAFDDTATDGTVTSTVVGNSIRIGIITAAPRTRVEHC